jgi:hypothetical protein
MGFTESLQQAATRPGNPFVASEKKMVPGLDANPELATVITIDASELKATFAEKIRGKPLATLRKIFYPQFKGRPPKGASGSSRYWSVASNFTKFVKTNEFFKRLQIKLDDEAKFLLKGLLEMFEDQVFKRLMPHHTNSPRRRNAGRNAGSSNGGGNDGESGGGGGAGRGGGSRKRKRNSAEEESEMKIVEKHILDFIGTIDEPSPGTTAKEILRLAKRYGRKNKQGEYQGHVLNIFKSIKNHIMEEVKSLFELSSGDGGFCVSKARADAAINNETNAIAFFNARMDIMVDNIKSEAVRLVEFYWEDAVKELKYFTVDVNPQRKRLFRNEGRRFFKGFCKDSAKARTAVDALQKKLDAHVEHLRTLLERVDDARQSNDISCERRLLSILSARKWPGKKVNATPTLAHPNTRIGRLEDLVGVRMQSHGLSDPDYRKELKLREHGLSNPKPKTGTLKEALLRVSTEPGGRMNLRPITEGKASESSSSSSSSGAAVATASAGAAAISQKDAKARMLKKLVLGTLRLESNHDAVLALFNRLVRETSFHEHTLSSAMNTADCPPELNDVVLLIGFAFATRRCVDVYLPDFKRYRINPGAATDEATENVVSASYKVLWHPMNKWTAVIHRRSLSFGSAHLLQYGVSGTPSEISSRHSHQVPIVSVGSGLSRLRLPSREWRGETVQPSGQLIIYNIRTNEVRIPSQHLDKWEIMQEHLLKPVDPEKNWVGIRRVSLTVLNDLVKLPSYKLAEHSAPAYPPIYRRKTPLGASMHTIAGNIFYAMILDLHYCYEDSIDKDGRIQPLMRCFVSALRPKIFLSDSATPHHSPTCNVFRCEICAGRWEKVKDATQAWLEQRANRIGGVAIPRHAPQPDSPTTLRDNKCRGYEKDCDEDVVTRGARYCRRCAFDKQNDM